MRDAGAALMADFGCGTCHSIPGVPGADRPGRPAARQYRRANDSCWISVQYPDNMIAWLERPQSIVPGNAMPNMEINDHDAKDITAYLLTLR